MYTDHLYFADEDVWLADVSTNGGFRVTQHFRDALGREVEAEGNCGVWTTDYDAFGRVVAQTDAQGQTTYTTPDALGRTLSRSGDAYPLLYGYDTEGRKTRSATTRDNGATWDVTCWDYDAASGVNTAKVYADGSESGGLSAQYSGRTSKSWPDLSPLPHNFLHPS